MKMAVRVEKTSCNGYSLLILRDDDRSIFPVVSLTIRTDVCKYLEELIKKDQARMPVDGNISPIFDNNANIIGLCFTIFPVTRNSYLRYLGSMKY